MTGRSAKTLQFLTLSCALGLAAAASGIAPIADGDIFWHLAAGREIWRSGQLLHIDPFSVGAAGRPWTDVHWLFQLAAFGVHSCFGLSGLVLAKCALVGCAACLMLWSNPRSARTLTAIGLVALLFCARHLLLVRPVIVTLVMLGFFCLLLERQRKHAESRLLWLLPLAQIVWCNCQGLSALGPGLVAAYSCGALAQRCFGQHARYPFAPEALSNQRSYLRTLLGCFAGCSLACLVTPFGLSSLSLPWRLLARLAPGASNPFQQIAENVPSFALERAAADELWHLKWFMGILALAIVARPLRCRIRLSQVLVVVSFTGLALAANRNVLLLYVVALPFAARQLTPALRLCRYRLRRWRSSAWTPWLARGTFALMCSIVITAAAREPQLSTPTPFHFPVESATAIAAHGGEGRIFNADHHGGYLIWKLYPQFRPYFDTRWILRSSDELEDYLALVDEPARFDEFAAQHGFAYAVLPVAYPSRYLPLAAHLQHSRRWRLVFTNGSEVLFANSDLVQAQAWNLADDATTDHILASQREAFTGSTELQRAARMQLAMLEIALGEHAQAERALQGLSMPAAQALRAQARLLGGDLPGAEQLARGLLQAGADKVRGLTLLASVSLRRQQLPEAFSYLRRAVALDPFDEDVTRLLRSLEGFDDLH